MNGLLGYDNVYGGVNLFFAYMRVKTGSPRAADKIVETIPLTKGESYKETKALLTQEEGP